MCPLTTIARVLCAAGLALAMCAGADAQQRYAVLVGVSEYPKSTSAVPLPGARNDVRLMRQVLARAGFRADDIVVLADGVEGAAMPTRQNILRTLERLAEAAKPGDFFYFHFSGHGSQQPAASHAAVRRTEPDGLHEVFLPIDIGRWDGSRSTVTNAIVNYELDTILERFLDRGAFVWAVFDACHSASLMRGEQVQRQVSPSALGIPDKALAEAAASAATRGPVAAPSGSLATRNSSSGQGGYVVFYAAQTTETAAEMLMPLDLPAGSPLKKRHGVMTYTLAEALSTMPAASYRQLSQFILSRYSTQYISARPTPLFTGDRLDAPVFGNTVHDSVRQWQVAREGDRLRIPAGTLAQVGAGTLLAVLPGPFAPVEQAIGHAEVSEAGLFAAELRPVAAGGRTLAVEDVKNGMYARLVRPAISLDLRVAKPTFAGVSASARRVVEHVVANLRERPPPGARIEWQAPRQAAEVRLHAESGRLWLLPASGVLVKTGDHATASIPVGESADVLARQLGASLSVIAKAVNIIRVAEKLPAIPALEKVSVRLEVAVPGTAPREITEIRPRFQDGDAIGFTVANGSQTAIDVTMLYVASDSSITPIFPARGESNRIERGAVLRTGPASGIAISDATVGTEHLVVIIVAASPQSERADYTYLAQAGLGAVRSQTRAPSLLTAWLEEAAFARTDVAPTRGSRPPDAVMQIYTFDVGRVGAPRK